MRRNLSAKQLRLHSLSIRPGISTILGILTLLLLFNLVSVASSSFTLAALPKPGDLDTTFGTGGFVTTRISTGAGENAAAAVAIQPDGKIVAVGYAPTPDYNFVVVRYTASGALDSSFGGSGIVTTAIGPVNDYARDVALQPDGKIVVVGQTNNGNDFDFGVVRYTASGALDTTFGSNGIVITPIGPGRDFANSLAIDADGRIVVVGWMRNNSKEVFATVRYTESGQLDTTFGSNGIVTTSVGLGDDGAGDVIIQPDGKIVVGGWTNNGSDDDFAVVRYTDSGQLDTTFGSGGSVTTPISSGEDGITSIAIQADGKIVAAGWTDTASTSDFVTVRYTAAGTLDTTFGSSGIVITPIGSRRGYAEDIALQADGKIVAVGKAYDGTHYDSAVVRYTGYGQLDTTFGNGGIVTTSISSDKDYASGVDIQTDGKIVAAGRSNNGSDDDFAVVRYHAGYFIYLPLVLKQG